jgi:hypothetical protein
MRRIIARSLYQQLITCFQVHTYQEGILIVMVKAAPARHTALGAPSQLKRLPWSSSSWTFLWTSWCFAPCSSWSTFTFHAVIGKAFVRGMLYSILSTPEKQHN